MQKFIAAFGLVVTIAATAYGQGATVGGALPGPLPLFPPDNWWNSRITDAPVDPASASFISFIGTSRRLHPDFGGNADEAPEIYGIPYVTVPGSQPLVPVVFEYDDESDYAAPGRPPGYPIPEQAKTQPRWIEGGYPATQGDGDRHLLLIDRDNRILYELYATHWNAGLNRWEAGSGAIFPLDTNHRRPDGWTSADAAGLAILPGLVRYDEVYGLGPIEHAFRVTVRATNGYVYPASHRAGSNSSALPMGARLRLKNSKNISGYDEPIRKIFQAFKDYGLIVADNGSDMYVTGTYDTRWSNDILNPAFASLTASDFEVVKLGWQPTACNLPSITTQPRSVSVKRGSSATLSVIASGATNYQWYRGASGDTSSPVSGATGSAYAISSVQSATNYWVRVSNSCGEIDSASATVSISGRTRPVRRS